MRVWSPKRAQCVCVERRSFAWLLKGDELQYRLYRTPDHGHLGAKNSDARGNKGMTPETLLLEASVELPKAEVNSISLLHRQAWPRKQKLLLAGGPPYA